MPRSRDLKTWTYVGHANAAVNACVIVVDNEYVLFQSAQGRHRRQAVHRSASRRDEGVLMLGKKD